MDSTNTHYWGKEKDYCLDYCGGEGHDVYRSLDELLIHLEESYGPMHHAAAAYLRSIYYHKKRPIPSGTILHDVDNENVVLKQEQEDNV